MCESGSATAKRGEDGIEPARAERRVCSIPLTGVPMDTAALVAWASPDGRIGRREYWLHFLLPALVLTVSSLVLPLLGWAALWIFGVGCWKRIRDLPASARMKKGMVGLWIAATAVAAVIAAALFLFGLLMVMGNGGPGPEPFWIGAGLVLVVPTGAALLIAGFVPGGPSREGAVSLPGVDAVDGGGEGAGPAVRNPRS